LPKVPPFPDGWHYCGRIGRHRLRIDAANRDLGSGAHERSHEQVRGRTGVRAVAPRRPRSSSLGALGRRCGSPVRKPEQAADEGESERLGRAATVETARVSEDDDPDVVVGRDRHLGEEAGHDAVMTDGAMATLVAEEEPLPNPRHPGPSWKCGSNMDAKVSGTSTEPCSLAPPCRRGGDVASHVPRGGVRSGPARGQHLAVDDGLESAGAQHVPRWPSVGGPTRTGPGRCAPCLRARRRGHAGSDRGAGR
jgi:hypothetical protein